MMGSGDDEGMRMHSLTIEVRDGVLDLRESWVYVWRSRTRPGEPVVYVGSTGMPPALRTWLHLNHEDPDVGRVGHGYAGAAEDALTVQAFRLEDDVDRQVVKQALIDALDRAGRLGSAYIGPQAGGATPPEREAAVVEQILDQLSR